MRKFFIGIAVSLFVFFLAVPAQAHHPIVSGEVACSRDGHQVVMWTATNSESVISDGGNERTMTLDQAGVSVGSLDGFGVGTDFLPQPLPTSTRNATTDLPGMQTGTVTFSVRADWNMDGPQDVMASTSVTLHGDCHPSSTTTTAVPVTTSTTTISTTTTSTTLAPTSILARTGGPNSNVVLVISALAIIAVCVARLRKNRYA